MKELGFSLTDAKVTEVFKKFDADGSGAIEAEELKDAMKALGYEATKLEVERIIQEIDKDGSGSIEY